MGRLIRKKEKAEWGQSMVEFALIVPLFLLLVFAIVDFGMGFHAWITVTNSAREGARVGVVGADSATITQRVNDTAGSLSGPNLTVTVANATDQGGDSGEEISVSVQYDYQLITPVSGLMDMLSGGSLGPEINFHATSKMRIE